MVGFSVVAFSTLSSSINKTTSSKASGTESTAMQDFGGKNNPCAIDPDTKEYYCNADTNLVCSGSLDFWLSTQTTRDKIMSDKKTMLEKGPKCVDPAEIPMGKEGQICRPPGSVTGQCDSQSVCVNLVGDKWPTLSNPYRSYFEAKYKGYDLTYFEWALRNYFHVEINPTDGSLVGTYRACIPENLSKVESCGDEGQKACKNELGNYYCFGENRMIDDEFYGSYPFKCVKKSKSAITSKQWVRCDNASSTCEAFCESIGAKCFNTCESKATLSRDGQQEEVTVRSGMYEAERYPFINNKPSVEKIEGSCQQNRNTFPDIWASQLNKVCNIAHNLYCCCNKK